MGQVTFVVFICYLVSSWTANAVRVSPKLDFGESQSDRRAVSAGIRPSFETRYRNNGDVATTYRKSDIQPVKTDNIEIVCVSGNCNTTKVKTDSEGTISADVSVHIKTNLDTAKNKTDTVEPVPDVPIVVGTKTSITSTIENQHVDVPNSFINTNYPATNTWTPPRSNGFVPSIPTFFQNTELYSDSQVRGFNGINNYAPRFQGTSNGIDLQTPSYEPRFNPNNYGGVPSQPWQSRRAGGVGGYNPVEFRKTYSNIWTPVQWTRSNPSNHERRNVGIPRWTPCVCPNSAGQNFPTTQGYPPPNHPAGINGKLGTLI